MLELFVSRYMPTNERTNADRDHKILTKQHKTDTHSNHILNTIVQIAKLVITSPFLLSLLKICTMYTEIQNKFYTINKKTAGR